MKALSRQTKLYIFATILLGSVFSVWQLAHLDGANLWLALVVSVIACVTQILKVEGATNQSSYNVTWMIYGFTFVLLGAPATLLVILVSHVADWAWYKYPWYIQAFNMGMFAIVIQATGLFYDTVSAGRTTPGAVLVLDILLTMAVFTSLNHLLVGVVLKLARGMSLAQSGVFGFLTLMIDFTLLSLGTAAGLIWQLNPFATILTFLPLYLIYSTLKVPALQRQSETDAKTGLFNARHLMHVFGQELARADRFDRPLTVVMADLDYMRNVNNTYGHLAGDMVLIGIAKILQKSVREYDVVARYGGEEFCILMPETQPQDALPHIESIRAAIEAAQFEVNTSVTPIKITMSFGISGRQKFGQPISHILHEADLAVYQVKTSGRNRVCLFSNDSAVDTSQVAPLAPTVRTEPARKLAPPLLPPPAAASSPPEPQQTETPPPTLVKPGPAWWANLYIGGVAVVALALAGLFLPTAPTVDWPSLIVFAVIVVIAEWLAIEVYSRDTTVSTSAAPFLAGVLLFGPIGALTLSIVLAGTSQIRQRGHLSRLIFNTSNHLISGFLCVILIELTGRLLHELPTLTQTSLSLLSASIVYFSSTLLIAGVISLSSGQPFQQVWSERFLWLAPYYAALGLGAYTLIFSYLRAGFAGVLVTLVPLLMLRFSQKQFLDHTTALVRQLRATNTKLVKQSQENTRLNEDLMLALSSTIDLLDPYVQGHSRNVARYAELIAKEMSLPPTRVELVRKAGLLHDIGKIGMPESILLKPAALTEEEYNVMKEHAALGAEVIEQCHSLAYLAPLIRHHHEYYNGSGYPDHLQAEAIPLEARIVSLADAVEAMASDRPYRQAISRRAILNEIQDKAGTQFDPEVVTAFIQLMQKEGEAIIINSAGEVGADTSHKLDGEKRAVLSKITWRDQLVVNQLFSELQAKRVIP